MRRLMHAELTKLTSTRSGLAFMLLPVLYPAVMSVTVTLADPEASTDALETLRGTGDVIPVIWLLIGALAITGEFRHGSIVTSLVATPDRRGLLTGKLAALGLAAIASTSAAIAVGLGAAHLATEGSAFDGITFTEWGQTAAALLAAAVLFALIGCGAGTLLTDQTAAAIGLLLWITVGENMLPTVLGVGTLRRWLLSGAANSLVDVARPTADSIGAGTALAVLVLTSAVIVSASLLLFERRDINP